MPSSGSSARMASRKPICGASLVEAPAHLGLPLLHVHAAGGPPLRRQRVDQAAQNAAGVANERHGGACEPFRLFGIGVDADDGELGIDAPLREAVEQPGADAEHHVGFAPQFAAERQRDA